MNKHELVKELALSMNISQKLCRVTLDTFFEKIVNVLEQNDQYNQIGFGTFKTEVSKERVSFNPSIRKKILLPKKRKIKFKPSAKLKEIINE